MKHDRFVKPNSTTIVHEERPPRERPEPPEPTPSLPPTNDNNDLLIVEKHFYSESDDLVLYEESEFLGEFNFRDTILDQLERYWVYLDRMRKYDIDAYEFYKQIGSILIPHPTFLGVDDYTMPEPKKRSPEELEQYRSEIFLTPWFKKCRPGFGCVAWGIDPAQERRELRATEDARKKNIKHWLMVPKFFYFVRYDRPPPNLEMRKGGDIYKLTVWWDRPHDPRSKYKYGRPTEFAVHIDNEARMRVLRVKAFHGGYWRDWHIPAYFKEWSKDHGLDVQSHLTHLFCDALRWIEYAQYSMVRVRVTKGDMTAVFGVKDRKLGYFFQDRDIVINNRGHRVKIFHSVRAHARRDGTIVPFHFRGEREFTWAGYDVLITVPGYHHLDYADCQSAVTDAHWIGNHPRQWEKKGFITEKQFGARLDAAIRRGVGGWNKS